MNLREYIDLRGISPAKLGQELDPPVTRQNVEHLIKKGYQVGYVDGVMSIYCPGTTKKVKKVSK